MPDTKEPLEAAFSQAFGQYNQAPLALHCTVGDGIILLVMCARAIYDERLPPEALERVARLMTQLHAQLDTYDSGFLPWLAEHNPPPSYRSQGGHTR